MINAFLIDGPVSDARWRREKLIADMTADLIRFDAFACESDSLRTLLTADYAPIDIATLGEVARWRAAELVERNFDELLAALAVELERG